MTLFWLSFFLSLVLPAALLTFYAHGLAWVATNLALWGGGDLVRVVAYGLGGLLLLLFLGHTVWAVRIALNSEIGAISRFAPSVAVLLLLVRPAVLVVPTLAATVTVSRVRSWFAVLNGRRR